jgi:hypothetical protein
MRRVNGITWGRKPLCPPSEARGTEGRGTTAKMGAPPPDTRGPRTGCAGSSRGERRTARPRGSCRTRRPAAPGLPLARGVGSHARQSACTGIGSPPCPRASPQAPRPLPHVPSQAQPLTGAGALGVGCHRCRITLATSPSLAARRIPRMNAAIRAARAFSPFGLAGPAIRVPATSASQRQQVSASCQVTCTTG